MHPRPARDKHHRVSPLRILILIAGIASLCTLPIAFGALAALEATRIPGTAGSLIRAGQIALVALPFAGPVVAIAAWRARGAFAWLLAVSIPVAPVLAIAGILGGQAMAARDSGLRADEAPSDNLALAAFLSREGAPDVLVLRGRGLTAVPPAIFAAAHLREIVLTDNAITRLPDELLGIPALRIVHIRNNPVPQAEIARFARVQRAQGRDIRIIP